MITYPAIIRTTGLSLMMASVMAVGLAVAEPPIAPKPPGTKPEAPVAEAAPDGELAAIPTPKVKPDDIPPAAAPSGPYERWAADFRSRLLAKGEFSAEFLDEQLADLKLIQRAIELDRRQPERTLTHAEYLTRVVSQTRTNQGIDRFKRYREDLRAAEEKFGVPAEIVTALWGIETSYGAITGGFVVRDALATLAFEGRRRSFFEAELVNLLKIIEQEDRDYREMLGSWAGAMGQSQFMPSSFLAYAVDGDGDGKRDIWGTQRDVFASAANYLKQSGWREGERWGRAVSLPSGFDRSLVGSDTRRSINAWRDLGVTLRDGSELPPALENFTARLIQPDGAGGPAFLAYRNFDVILRWNRSNYFATAVGILSDRILIGAE
ncbi:MAG: lytic murein transglycosylase [Alphaproteobacteria bacterium]|nr:lytic murein transglycosylase [Alphaproteobacteria bacterium SS10]